MRRVFLTPAVLLAIALAACNGGEGGAAPDGDVRTELVPAPIEEAEVIVRESDPPQYAVRVVSGIPDGCHSFAEASAERQGTRIEVTVLNERQVGDVACTQLYGTQETVVELGTDFEMGTEYTVDVNGEERLTFTAQ
jgi:hypothetical protein